jgi:FixJ family two-component response regulator
MSQGNPTVFLVDDDPSVLRALGRILATEGFAVQACVSPTEFLALHNPTTPGCLVTDVAMPEMNGLDLLRALRVQAPQRFVVFITGKGDIPMTVTAMKAGAVSFLPKPVRREDLLAAVREALWKDAQARAMYEERAEIATRFHTLTPRERQVLQLVAAGMLNKQIAAKLGAAEKTIKVHRGRLLEKMHVRSAAALVGLLGRAPDLIGSSIDRVACSGDMRPRSDSAMLGRIVEGLHWRGEQS